MQHNDFTWQPGCLQNETVILSAVQQKDFEALYHVAADPEIWEQHPDQDRYKKEVFRNYFSICFFDKRKKIRQNYWQHTLLRI